jgi:hypothetical protein
MDQDKLQQLIKQLQEGNDRERRAASYKLGKSRDQEAVPALICAYNDKDGTVRQNVIDGLRLMNTIEAAEFLLKKEQCKVGNHSWIGCKCSQCGLFRNEQHDLDDNCKCLICGQELHTWDGCKCTRCSKVVHNRYHAYKCSNCGTVTESPYHWNCTKCNATIFTDIYMCKCSKCGEELPHDISAGMKCYYCNKYQDHEHRYILFGHRVSNVRNGPNYYKCEICGEVNSGYTIGFDTIDND